MGKRTIKAHIRKTCRKCRRLLVNKPEFGAVCPVCGWFRKSWTTNEEVIEDEADVMKPAKTEREGDNNDSENSTDSERCEGSEAAAESDC